MKNFLKIFIFILLLFNLSWAKMAKIRVGMYPVDVRGPSEASSWEETLSKIILEKLSSPPQIEVFLLTEPPKKKNADYFLLLYVWIMENEAYVDYKLFKETPSKPYFSFVEKVRISELESRIEFFSERIREKLIMEAIPFWSKINPLKNLPFKNLKTPSFTSFFKEEERYRVKFSIPPPPPPFIYSPSQITQIPSKVIEGSSLIEKPAELNSPWQWF